MEFPSSMEWLTVKQIWAFWLEFMLYLKNSAKFPREHLIFDLTRHREILIFLSSRLFWNKRILVTDRIEQHRHPSHYYHRDCATISAVNHYLRGNYTAESHRVALHVKCALNFRSWLMYLGLTEEIHFESLRQHIR